MGGKVFGPFSLTVDGEEQVKVAVSQVRDLIDDMRPFWPAWQDAFFEVENEQFASQGEAGREGAWTPLSPAYAKRKAAMFGNTSILVASGAMFGSLTGPGPGHVFLSERDQMMIGTDVIDDETGFAYPVGHQRGLGNNPRRKPIDISSAQETLFGRALHETARMFGAAWSQRGGVRGAGAVFGDFNLDAQFAAALR